MNNKEELLKSKLSEGDASKISGGFSKIFKISDSSEYKLYKPYVVIAPGGILAECDTLEEALEIHHDYQRFVSSVIPFDQESIDIFLS